MVISIARQSVILKCQRRKSVMVSNYELYYAAGLMNKCFGLNCTEDMQPDELSQYLLDNIEKIEPEREEEGHLLKMISLYEPLDNYDDQMKSLFRWGATEEDMWQVNTSRKSE